MLRSKGYDVAVDGAFGPFTHGALRHYQRSNGQKVTGVWLVEDQAPSLPPLPPPPDLSTIVAENVRLRNQVNQLGADLVASEAINRELEAQVDALESVNAEQTERLAEIERIAGGEADG